MQRLKITRGHILKDKTVEKIDSRLQEILTYYLTALFAYL